MAEKIEAGIIVEGKVVRIKPFGAIVQLENGGQGLVHISQIANGFVQDINDHVTVGDTVKVKVMSVDEETEKLPFQSETHCPSRLKLSKALSQENIKIIMNPEEPDRRAADAAQPKEPVNDFEEKMKEWLKQSNERQAGINKRNNRRNGGY